MQHAAGKAPTDDERRGAMSPDADDAAAEERRVAAEVARSRAAPPNTTHQENETMGDWSKDDLVVEPGEGEKTSADMVMIVRSAKLAGHFSVMEGEVRPKELLAFHTHANEDQHMYIISGLLHFEVGGKDGIRFTAGPGSHVLKPRGISHGFWNLGTETARYVETSIQDGFEKFVDSRSEGLGAMVDSGQSELGMSFETDRALEVMKEFNLTGLAGANLPSPKELLRDPAFGQLMKDETNREFFLYLAGVKIKEAVKGLF